MTKRKTAAAKKPKPAKERYWLTDGRDAQASDAAKAEGIAGRYSDLRRELGLQSLRPLEDLSAGLLARLDNGIEVTFAVAAWTITLTVRSKQP